MCNETPFQLFHDGQKASMADIDLIRVEEGQLVLVNLKGEKKVIPGQVKLIDFIARRIEVG